MKVSYRVFACSEVEVRVIYLLENKLTLPKEELNKNITYAQSRNLFNGKNGELYTFTMELMGNYQNVVLVGLGKEEELNLDKIRKATAKAIRKAKELKANKIFLRLPINNKLSIEEMAKNVTIAAHLADYTFNKYKTDKEKENDIMVSIGVHGVKEASSEILNAIEEGNSIAKGIILARDLVNEPANVIYPETLAQAAIDAGKENGFEVEVFGVEKIKELKMEAFYSVAKASEKEPKLIVMRYFGNPEEKEEIMGLVGKGLTYDSGGYSLKPTSGMVDMKSDMGGAASVIGSMSIIASRKLKVNVVGVIAACENMISGGAYKPGDIIGSMAGKTIEIRNTDAEGRLTLVDAVTYIIEKENASAVIDLATLTGAALVALGDTTTAVVTNNDKFYEELKEVSAYTGEKFWQLPAFDEYREMLKSEVADLNNSPGRNAGTITAGLFIGEFVKDKPWLHLDIAGTAWADKKTDLTIKGGTGSPVYTLYELVKNKSK
ncbi:leucyl aminopeptidase [Caproiciproducens sp. MSJ-32]|uniref:leucyl aminopeptidase n=1 Tax=Caproiciproducens sp. MSJ-32 TaxID=2841527 RepID=UPI001C1186E9|nr:leucyl aminopeptidase [Caproiciproducens sp. MSJ-32]MBU5454691.1 leucyl aminopeptidase [Caproiciproducens sp. MSJ-32]